MRDGLMPRLVRAPAPVALAVAPPPEQVPATVVHTLEADDELVTLVVSAAAACGLLDG